MQQFNVLSRSTPIYRSALLEASAGTGKTFAIEHLVVRLLIEEDPDRGQACTLPEILAVTFTRAATREMKARIRHNIAKAIQCLRNPDATTSTTADYLQRLLTTSIQHQALVRMRLEDALACFDEAQIFTLHGLCAQALRSHPDHIHHHFSEKPISEIAFSVIDDFFRTGVSSEQCCAIQLKRVLGHFRGDIEALKEALIRQISKGLPIIPEPTFNEHFETFVSILSDLQRAHQWQGERLLADFDHQVTQYKNFADQSAQAHRPAIARFAALFNKTEWTPADFESLLRDDLILAKLTRKVKSKANPEVKIWYPESAAILQNTLLPLVTAARDPKRIFAWMAHACQKSLQTYLHEEEIGGPDQILQQMRSALDDPLFLAKIKTRYRVAIVDECQDTDPLQWDILNRLFLHAEPPRPHLILVGDPKQSIYAFRQADIYTYLSAANRFADQDRLALRVNYRSQPKLVDAINHLFHETYCPGSIALPRTDSFLPFPKAQAAQDREHDHLNDARAAIHFLLLKAKRGRLRTWPGEDNERELMFPAIAREILQLKKQNIHYSDIAILVRDRHQAALMQQVLDAHQIPALTQRQGSLAASPALPLMIEWLESMANPHDTSARNRVLAGPLIRLPADELLADHAHNDKIYQQIQLLRTKLTYHGFAVFFDELLHTQWHLDKPSVIEQLVGSSATVDLYRDLRQIAQLIMDHQHRTHCGIQGLLTFLDRFPTLEQHDDERLHIVPDLTLDRVRILTIHMSKGLEYDIVFAPGLMKRTNADELLTTDFTTKPPCLRVANEDSEPHLAFCREQDAEKARQAYVAMTRARRRLYLTVAFAEDKSNAEIGEAAPIELLLARLDRPLTSDDAELYDRINAADGQDLCRFIDSHADTISLSYQWISAQEIPPLRTTIIAPQITLQAPPTLTIPRCSNRMVSFTSLQESVSLTKELPLAAPHDFSTQERSKHTLPAGRETGILLHQLLETLSFASLANTKSEAEMLALVQPHLPSQFTDWAHVVASMLFHGMHTPLPFDSGICSLSHIEPHLVSRETSFQFPSQKPQGLDLYRGSIDLLIHHDDRYYLIDWKSNWLGPTREHYDQNSLHAAVEQNGYLLQAQIYIEALKRYLRLTDRRPFDACFGGAFFLFLRGLDATASDSNGIYWVQP